MCTVPNFISIGRMAAVPVLLWSAWHGQARVFLPLFGAMLLSDLLDGLAARWLRQQTELGARLDSWADLLTWLPQLPALAISRGCVSPVSGRT